MIFSHLADCHIGAWRDQRLRDLNTQAFIEAIDKSVEKHVDFILISGDLFNTALPGIESLKDVVKKLKELKDADIPVYIIPGSHDFSPTGKTMLDVLQEAGLCMNVVRGSVHSNRLRLKFTIDRKTGVKITGMLGRRGMLERSYYNDLDRSHLEDEEGFKIFMFHTSISELKPRELAKMESSPISLLPKNFDYYAGGHVHIVEKKDLPGYKNIVYPGPLFPNTFHELEELKKGGFYIYDNGRVLREEIEPKKVVAIKVEATIPEKTTGDILDELHKHELNDTLVLIRVVGSLESGKVSDINFKSAYDYCFEQKAYFVMRSTSLLQVKEYEEVKVDANSPDIESKLISEHIGKIKVMGWDDEKEADMIRKLMSSLSAERKEGEKVYEFEERIRHELDRIIDI